MNEPNGEQRTAKLPRRPRDTAQLAKLALDMATGEVPNDKAEVLAALSEQAQPTGRQGALSTGCQPDARVAV